MNTSTLKGARRATVIVIIVAFAASAVIGIYALLAGNMNETVGKVLGTTAVVGLASVSILCHLAIVGRAIRVIGFVGIAASLVAFVTAMVMIWTNWAENWDAQGQWGKALLLSALLAGFLAQANLLLLLSTRKQPIIRYTLLATLDANPVHGGNDERAQGLLYRLALLEYNDGSWRRSHPVARRLFGMGQPPHTVPVPHDAAEPVIGFERIAARGHEVEDIIELVT